MAMKSADNSSVLLHGFRKPLLLTTKYIMQCSVVEYRTALLHSHISDKTVTMQFLSFLIWRYQKVPQSYTSATKVTLVAQSYMSAKLQWCHTLRKCYKSYRSAILGYISSKMRLQKCLYVSFSLSPQLLSPTNKGKITKIFSLQTILLSSYLQQSALLCNLLFHICWKQYKQTFHCPI